MKKILSIDGGGIRGIIPALVLAEIEKKTGKPIHECFDLIAGTSTGGILALGLTKDNGAGKPKYTANNLADIYISRGKEIFNRSFWKGVSSVSGLNDELYSHEGIENVLYDCFDDDTFGKALTNTLLTSYDIENREPVFLKSWKDDHKGIKIKEAARAISAAPTYFEPSQIKIKGKTVSLVDGGVFINTPSVSAYVEAKKMFEEENEFFLVSLGTGELTRKIMFEEARDWGKPGWILPLLSCMFDGMSDASNYQMELLLGDNYVRLQTELNIASDDLDNVSNGNIENLKSEAKTLINNNNNKKKIKNICDVINS